MHAWVLLLNGVRTEINKEAAFELYKVTTKKKRIGTHAQLKSLKKKHLNSTK